MKGPLAGLRVIEVAQFAAGPSVGLLLADLGAEVIKLEPPGGDPTRTRSLHHVRGESAYFMYFNRGKRSVVVDLKHAEGRLALHDLIRHADIFVSNLRPGALDKLQLDYASLRDVNPRLVACSVTGFGSVGPDRDRPSFDALPQALSGLMSITGEPGRGPVVAGAPIGDLSAGMFAAMGILAALVQRSITGVGQHVDISMLDSMVWLVGYPAAYYLASGQVPGPMGSGHENASPYGAYAGADDRNFFVAAHHVWDVLCRAIGREDLIADDRFATHADRLSNRLELDRILAEEFRRKPAAVWLDILASHDIPVAPVNNLQEVFADPHVLARNMLAQVDHPDGGSFPAVGNPMKFSSRADEHFSVPPNLAADTESVFAEIVNYSPERIAQLVRDGVIHLPAGKT